MKLSSYSKQARQARSRMQRLTSVVAYAQMDQLMGKTEISRSLSANGPVFSSGRKAAEKSSR